MSNASDVKVFSVVPHPLVAHFKEGGDKGRRVSVQIKTGRNLIPHEKWEKVKERFEPKIEKGHIRTSRDLNQRELADLVGSPSKGFITDLCAKSNPVDTGEIEPNSGHYELVHD